MWTVRVAQVATLGLVPGPEVFWMERFQEWLPLDFNVALAQNGGRTVLINTGPPLDGIAEMNRVWRGELGEQSQLRLRHPNAILGVLGEWGIAPKEVTDVLVTPLQAYAVGGVDQFPNAQVWISRRGWEDLLAPPRFDPRRRMAVPDRLLRYLLEDAWFQQRVHLLPDEAAMGDGLRVWWAGTHHRSSLAIEIETGEGLVTFTDTVFYYQNVEEDRPLGIQESLEECRVAYERLRRSGARVVSAYDPTTLDRYPGGYVTVADRPPAKMEGERL